MVWSGVKIYHGNGHIGLSTLVRSRCPTYEHRYLTMQCGLEGFTYNFEALSYEMNFILRNFAELSFRKRLVNSSLAFLQIRKKRLQKKRILKRE